MIKFKEYLLKENKNLDHQFVNASHQGNLELVKELLAKGANINAKDDQALIYASSNDHLDVVEYLISKGANIHANDDEALGLASFKGYLNVVKYLISKGADIHANNDRALRWASVNGQLDIIKYLVSKYDPKYVIDKWPKYAEYITDPNYSHAKFAGKYKMFGDKKDES
jgi:ankyrin repeat protein